MLVALIDPSLAALLAMAVVTAILLRRSYRYFGRRRRREPVIARTPRPADPRAADPLVDAPADVLRHHVALHETARELSARLDSKMIALEHLIRMADERIGRLQALDEAAQRTE